MKATAIAPANIAFIKYWGKKDEQLRLPLNSSLSMNLSGSYTMTTVEFSPVFTRDSVEMYDGRFSAEEVARVITSIDLIRKQSQVPHRVRVVTKNTFPKGAGAAASASGFAALTVAGFAAAGSHLSENELSRFARLGSGSACRSIPDGFVFWEDEYAYSLYPPSYWDIRDALVIVDSSMKKVSTSRGMEDIQTSPKLPERLRRIPERILGLKKALAKKNFMAFGEITEEDCLDMHAVMQSQVPPLNYWNDATVHIMNAVREWRKKGVAAYFTIDAGPNVHIIYEGNNEEAIMLMLQALQGVQSIIVNTVAPGAHNIDTHLF